MQTCIYKKNFQNKIAVNNGDIKTKISTNDF